VSGFFVVTVVCLVRAVDVILVAVAVVVTAAATVVVVALVVTSCSRSGAGVGPNLTYFILFPSLSPVLAISITNSSPSAGVISFMLNSQLYSYLVTLRSHPLGSFDASIHRVVPLVGVSSSIPKLSSVPLVLLEVVAEHKI
jgi:hypothetical protein